MDALSSLKNHHSEALQKAIYDPQKFTPEQWAASTRFTRLVKQFGPILFKQEP